MFTTRQKKFVTRSRFFGRPLSWYLLLWMCLIYVGGVFGETTFLHSFKPCPQGLCPFVIATSSPLSPAFPVVLTFSILMGLLCLLLWLSMSGIWKSWRSWGSFLLQGVLVLIISFLPEQQQLYVVLSLYLALSLEALAVFQRARPVLLLGGFYGLLFVIVLVLSLFQDLGGTKLLDGASMRGPWLETLLGQSANYLALLLFAAGYLVMYVQQLRARAQLELAHKELQTSTARIQELTVLNERQRMARELHDTLVQDLAGLIRQLDVASALLAHERTERAQAILQESGAAARAALVEARSAIGDLRAEIPPIASLDQAVQEEIERFSGATGITCQCDLAALPLVPSSQNEQVVRAISEGLTNVARHAQAKHAWVRTSESGETLMIEIGDDGVGFSSEATMQTGHYGLVGLRERARLARGRFEVKSALGEGTVLLLHLPLEREEG
jgi:two-component system, NarL family, sensor histidine kinase YdfH